MELDFSKNLGKIDRIIRVIIGSFLLVLSISGLVTGTLAFIVLILAFSQFIEASLGY
jgi:hypothetical protein